jgi:hypothetical protein
MDLFREFKSNQSAASAAIQTLVQCVYALGAILKTCKHHKMSVPDVYVRMWLGLCCQCCVLIRVAFWQFTELEELLADASRYFSRFVRLNHRVYQLVSTDPAEKLHQFHVATRKIILELAKSVQLAPSGDSSTVNYKTQRYVMPTDVPKYYFICDKLESVHHCNAHGPNEDFHVAQEIAPYLAEISEPNLEEQYDGHEESKHDPEGHSHSHPRSHSHPSHTVERVTSEYKKELAQMKAISHQLTLETLEHLFHEQTCLIHQHAFRHVWLHKRSKKRRLTMGLRDFCELLRKELIHQHSLGSRESEDLVKIFAEIVNNKKPVTATDSISEVVLAKLLRHVPVEETSLHTAIKMVYPGVLAPPLVDMTVYFDAGQEQELTTAITSLGFSCITGPTLSGKTARLRHVMKQVIKDSNNTVVRAGRDVVWIDFDGVHTDVDGVMRISSQLFFKRCTTWTELEKQYKELLSSLRQGSIIVLDNIVLPTAYEEEEYKILNNASSLDLTRLDELQQRRKHSWKHLVLQLCKLGREYQDSLSFVIVSNVCEPFTAALRVKNVITIGPLAPQLAAEMAMSLGPTVLASTMITVDHKAITEAANCLAGEIELLVKLSVSLRSIRDLARHAATTEHASNSGTTTAARVGMMCDIFHHHLNSDEKLLTCVICAYTSTFVAEKHTNDGFFPMHAIWAMAKDVLGGDIVRFRLAWDALLEIGWIVVVHAHAHLHSHAYDYTEETAVASTHLVHSSSELGYKLSTFARLVTTSNSVLDPQFLYDNYVIYWTSELIRINHSGGESPSAMDEFARYSSHFRHVIDTILMAPAPKHNHNDDGAIAPIADHIAKHKRVLRLRGKLREDHEPNHDAIHAPTSSSHHNIHLSMAGDDLHHSHGIHVHSVHSAEFAKKTAHMSAHISARLSIHKSHNNAKHEDHHIHDNGHASLPKLKSSHSLRQFQSIGSSFRHRKSRKQPKVQETHEDTSRMVEHESENHDNEHVANLKSLHGSMSHRFIREASMTRSVSKHQVEDDASADWSCIPAQGQKTHSHSADVSSKATNQVSDLAFQVIIDMLAGNIGRVLSYHMPKLVGLKLCEQIVRHINPLESSNSGLFEAALVDFAEQCLRNGLIAEGMEYIKLVVFQFFSNVDSDFHDPPTYAARALLIQGRLMIEEDKNLKQFTHAHAIRALEAADRVLQLEGWSLADHHERRLCIHLKHECETAAAQPTGRFGDERSSPRESTGNANGIFGGDNSGYDKSADADKKLTKSTWGTLKNLVTATKK